MLWLLYFKFYSNSTTETNIIDEGNQDFRITYLDILLITKFVTHNCNSLLAESVL